MKKKVSKDFQFKKEHKKRDCCEESSHNDIGINKLIVKVEKLNDSDYCGISNNKKNGIEVCNQATWFDNNASQNLLIATKEYFVCEICNHRSRQISRFQVHMAQHVAGKTLFTCQLCNLKFTQKASLNFHMKKSHIVENFFSFGNKLYHCTLCNFANAQKGNLKTHFRTHSGEKPFKCKICKRKFTQLCHLQVHNRRHTGEKPFTCTFCSCKFTQKSNLEVHNMKTHKISTC